MRNQLDLIISSVAILLALIFAAVFYSTKKTVQKPAEPTKVNLAALALPGGDVKYGNSLPGGGGGSGGGGAMRGGGGGGGGGGRGGGRGDNFSKGHGGVFGGG